MIRQGMAERYAHAQHLPVANGNVRDLDYSTNLPVQWTTLYAQAPTNREARRAFERNSRAVGPFFFPCG